VHPLLNLFRILPSAHEASPRPTLAAEITPEGVTAAATVKGGSPQLAFSSIAEGALLPSLHAGNLVNAEPVTSALRSALDQVAGRSRTTTLVIPDAAVRVLILDFDTLPAKYDEADSIIRFRLKKLVPFDVDDAQVSYQTLSQKAGHTSLLAAVVPKDVLAEYENALIAAGYEVGAVLPASMASLAAAPDMEAELVVNLCGSTVTTAIVSGNELLLHRSLELPSEENAWLAELQRAIAVTAAYFEDLLGAPPARLLYTGAGGVEEIEPLLADLNLPVQSLLPRPVTGYTSPLPQRLAYAGVLGALAG
jgi:type IV pilus assembly protein PilM